MEGEEKNLTKNGMNDMTILEELTMTQEKLDENKFITARLSSNQHTFHGWKRQFYIT
jgi:hypothetical protein